MKRSREFILGFSQTDLKNLSDDFKSGFWRLFRDHKTKLMFANISEVTIDWLNYVFTEENEEIFSLDANQIDDTNVSEVSTS